MATFVLAYLAVGLVIGVGLFGWVAVSGIRRHGLREAIRAAARESLSDPPLLGPFAWLCVIAYPVLFVWAVVEDGFDAVGAALLALVWLAALVLLRLHLKAKGRRQDLR